MSLRACAAPCPALAPLGALVGACAGARAALYRRGTLRQRRLAGPVVSVGSLRMGGSGKTPVVARLAGMLHGEGRPVAVLSRGYRGSFRGDCLLVSDGQSVLADAEAAGDEPVMLARALPGIVVAVGRRRDVVGRRVEEAFGPRTHVLDDGFQHLRLHRDVDVVCVCAADLVDRPVPAGWLREGAGALARAHVVLLARDGAPELSRTIERLGPERTFLVSRRLQGFFSPDGAARPAPRRAYLLSGIARPERFETDVASLVGEIAGHIALPDHHRFTSDEIGVAVERARAGGADAIVTTEKDLVRLSVRPDDPPLLVLRISAAIEDEPRLRTLLLAGLGHAA